MRLGHPSSSLLICVVSIALVLAGCVAQSRGARRGAREGWTIIRPPTYVYTLLLDTDRVLAGGAGGVTVIDRRTGEVTDGIPCDASLEYVKALVRDERGLWIGHENGLTLVTDGACRTFTEADGLPDRRVLDLKLDPEGRLWIATPNGALRWDDGLHLQEQDGLLHRSVRVVHISEGGSLWFGSYVAPDGGVSILAPDRTWQTFAPSDGLPHANVTAIFEDRSGDVWVGTGLGGRGGASRFSLTGDTWYLVETLRYSDGLAGEKVRSIAQTQDGAMWFGSEYDGLARCHLGRWTTFTVADGLAHNEVTALRQDMDGDLWIATYDGLTRINAADLSTN